MSVSFLLLPLFFLVWTCGDPRGAGTATDTENTIAGVVVDSSGAGVSGVSVRLIPETAPVATSALSKSAVIASTGRDSIEVITDSRGRFRMSGVQDSVFHLHFQLKTDGKIRSVQLLKNLSMRALRERPLDSIRLRKPATLTGALTYLPGDNPLYRFSEHFRISIQGTGTSIPIISGRSFLLDGVPPGQQILLIYPADQYLVQALIRAGLPVDSLIRKFTLNFQEGDTLTRQLFWKLPPDFTWDLLDSALKRRPVLRGCVTDAKGIPVSGAQVRLITDPYGLSYANEGSPEFPTSDSTLAITDIDGCWSLPLWADSFNLEYLRWEKGSISGVALQKGFKKSAWINPRIISIDTAVLKSPASVRGMIRYTSEPSAWIEIGSHFKLGIAGTSRYVHTRPDMLYEIGGLPDNEQTLIFYPGDPFIWKEFLRNNISPEQWVRAVRFIYLTAGVRQEIQAVTYTLPAAD